MKRLPLLYNHIMYTLRGGFLVRPLIIALTLGCVGVLFVTLDMSIPALNGRTPGLLFPFLVDPQVAQVILGGIATSMMTVVSIVFAILLTSLALASMQYSPRILVSFARDHVTQQTLGIFLGTFLYCLAGLPAAHSLPHPFTPVITVLGAMALAFLCVACLLYFIHHISQAISVNHIVDNIAGETEAVIDEIMPLPLRLSRMPEAAPAQPGLRNASILSASSGYIRFIDTRRLVALAKTYKVEARVLRHVGHFVPAGVPILTVSKGDRITPEVNDAFASVFDLGSTRTLQQDIEFGILLIVDIALKAISPAVNDPSTAISCVDQLSRILIRFASREPQDSLLYDPPGVVRASIPWLGFERLVTSAFEQIRVYSKADIAVSLRMLRALTDIATTVSDPAYHQTLLEQGRRIVAGCSENLGADELREVRTRLSALEKLTTLPQEEALPQQRDAMPEP
jgi:uncharacterized membrane protein